MTRHANTLARLRADRGGVAMLEFALSLPIVLALGLYGIETANLALLNLKISQITLALADNASRVGTTNTLSQQQLREVDMNDVLQAARLQGAGINLMTNGRITISSLENVQQSYDTAPVQRIHWQRCAGLKSGTAYDSSYGATSSNDGSDGTQANDGILAPNGMGDANAMVSAPSGSGVMFVEVNYLYTPLVGYGIFTPSRIHYVASFIVRDRRVFTQIYNPSPTATASTCNRYTA
ncbi:hypothetical protein [Sphingomonas sp. CARO-RG-8B-R24-01]|uniref:TadE/TadG family type IV pilus assembly protein n=1 Tax=Sphingomonas sp. CARO-RG-8B-R24-01 TaxID=2914831 RepID=UPI001F56AC65|nr:hypothetical protein [Sphingomonas sp. CARO-RG-8B-R24-01]